MKKNSATDYLGYIAVKLFGAVIRVLPIACSLFLARRIGSLWYFLSYRQRSLVYVNIKTAFQGNISPQEIRKISRRFFQNLASDFIEALFIAKVDQKYLKKYIHIEGEEHIKEALQHKKGVILLGVHAGSWELANTIPALLGYSYNIFVRQQKYSKLDYLLNSYRVLKGCKLITRAAAEMRDVVRVLKNNEVLGTVCDQGGKSGLLVKFLGKEASMSTLGVRLALKVGCKVLPVFCVRTKGPYNKIIVKPIFQISDTGDIEKDVKENLERLSLIFQEHILRYPQEYFWLYKIWKYSNGRKITILSDGKTGHLRQSQTIGSIAQDCLKERGIQLETETIEVKFKSNFSKTALNFSCALAGRYSCQGCMWCLRRFLTPQTYAVLLKSKPDYVVSCGASLAALNFIFANENLAQSIVIMRPSLFSTSRFDMVVMPRHDNPPSRKNVIITEGALNLIDEEYLERCKSQIANYVSQKNDERLAISDKQLRVGVLLGGDTRDFKLSADLIRPLIAQIKPFLEKYDGEILITTSRRTCTEVETLIKEEFSSYGRCKLMVIANERNIPDAVGGILALSRIVIVSPESISMVSEAASCGKYVVVFGEIENLRRRHQNFIKYFAQEGYIYLSSASGVGSVMERLIGEKPPVKPLNDKEIVAQALKKRLK